MPVAEPLIIQIKRAMSAPAFFGGEPANETVKQNRQTRPMCRVPGEVVLGYPGIHFTSLAGTCID